MINYDHYRFSRAIDAVQRFSTSTVEGKKWLDLGCHNGSFARLLSSHGYHVTGIDVWDPELKTDDSWQYLQFDIDLKKGQIPIESNTFDVISALELIEHIVDTDRLLDEVYRILKPRALFVLSTPNICMLKNRFRVPLGLYPYGVEHKNIVHHVHAYNLKYLLILLAEHNFKALLTEGVKFLPQKLLRSNGTDRLAELLAKIFPSLCSNLFVVAQRC